MQLLASKDIPKFQYSFLPFIATSISMIPDTSLPIIASVLLHPSCHFILNELNFLHVIVNLTEVFVSHYRARNSTNMFPSSRHEVFVWKSARETIFAQWQKLMNQTRHIVADIRQYHCTERTTTDRTSDCPGAFITVIVWRTNDNIIELVCEFLEWFHCHGRVGYTPWMYHACQSEKILQKVFYCKQRCRSQILGGMKTRYWRLDSTSNW